MIKNVLITKHKRKLLVMLLSVITIVGAGIGIAKGAEVSPLALAEVVGTLSPATQIKDTYALGDNVSIPDGQISYDGQTYSAEEKYLVKPDGTIVSKDEVVLDKIGNYKVVYSKIHNGSIIKATKEFKVINGTYTLTGSKSTMEYGALVHGKENETGLKLKLKSGDKFLYNQAIDLSESDLSQPILTYYTSHGSKRIDVPNGYKECQGLYVQLTDCYDETNTITLYCDWWDNGAPYYRAYANGQMETGLTESETGRPGGTSKEYFREGKRYLCYMNNAGTYYWPIFGQQRTEEVGVSVYFDAATNSMWLGGKHMDIVTDFDDPDIYGTKLFKGFTTGEVYLSMWADRYIKEDVTVEIGTLNGWTGSLLNPGTVTDKTGPAIRIDDRGATSLKNLTIAKDERVKLFDAVAFDINSCTPVKRTVYYNYETATQAQVGSADGYFVPNKLGTYTVVYKSTDGFGNESVKTIEMNCKEVPGNKALTLTTEELTSLVAGKMHTLPAYTIESLNSGKKITISAKAPSGDIVEIDKDTREFLPKEKGTYTILYQYSDDIYSYEEGYEVQCEANGYVNFSQPYLPDTFIKNAKYSLDKIVATEYAADKVKQAAYKTYMCSDDQEEYVEIDIEEFKITANEKVKFKFVSGDYALETESVKVVDVGFGKELDMSKYFVGNVSAIRNDSSILFTSISNSGDTVLEFINTVSYSEFMFNFAIPQAKSNYAGVKIEIIDFYDRTNVETFLYKNVEGKLSLNYNGGADIIKTISFADTSFSLTKDSGAYIDNTGSKFDCTTKFTSDKALLKITLMDVKGSSAIEIKKICNQTFSSRNRDTISPILIPDYDLAGVMNIGDKVTLGLPDVVDILSPFYIKNLTITVLAPSGELVEGFDGTTYMNEAKLLTLNEYGIYSVSYAYIDQSNRSAENSFSILVQDRVAPILTINGVTDENYVEKAKVGATIKLLGYTVSDNLDTTETVSVKQVVYSPEYQVIHVKDGKFKATMRGDYKVCYYCFDTEGNYTMVSYTVSVSGNK